MHESIEILFSKRQFDEKTRRCVTARSFGVTALLPEWMEPIPAYFVAPDNIVKFKGENPSQTHVLFDH